MYIVLALVAASVIGVALHFLLPARALRGSALLPSAAAAAATALYAVLSVAGMPEASVARWLIVLGASALIPAALGLWLGLARRREDAAAEAAFTRP